MATTREGQLAKIARLMRDPRYWNKKHPEHPRVVADTTRAFENAYPEPAPETETTEGNVHVRAYTRVQDGKEIQVSQYDRTQQIAMRLGSQAPGGPRENVQAVAEGPLHRHMKEFLVERIRARGDTVITEVDLTTVGLPITARVDLLVRTKAGKFYAIEIKTLSYDDFSPAQMIVYPMLDLGKHIYSMSPRVKELGLMPGQLLPSMCVFGVYVQPGKAPKHGPLNAHPDCFTIYDE